jgi:hypothetical protein
LAGLELGNKDRMMGINSSGTGKTPGGAGTFESGDMLGIKSPTPNANLFGEYSVGGAARGMATEFFNSESAGQGKFLKV